MEKTINPEQFQQLDQKLDRVLEFIEQQNRKKEEIDDFITDASIVAKDAFTHSVALLDKAQVELDSCGLSCLFIRILQNIETFHYLLEMMESARDFMKDVSPILHQVGLDAVNKMNELDRKGYFDYIRQLSHLADKWIQTFTIEDLQKVENNLADIAGILRNLSNPKFIAVLNKTTRVITEVKMEDERDILSIWQIINQLRSKEVRKSISYVLKVAKNMGNQ